LAKLALLLSDSRSGEQQHRLSRILDFFGVRWKWVRSLAESDNPENEAVFGSAEVVAAAIVSAPEQYKKQPQAAFYIYAGEDLTASARALQSLCGKANVQLRQAPAGHVSLRVSREFADIAGPMAGIDVSLNLKEADAVITEASGFDTVIAAGEAPVFFRFQRHNIPVFFCTSSKIVDIDEPIRSGFYDVKQQFCSAVPLVMFIRHIFPEVAWGPQELGACLIVDDPLLRKRYGSCDFWKLGEAMRAHDFTTNIAFIPWNWRRTAPAVRDFFGNESGRFSVSIHGCDHIGAEFGATSPDVLNSRAKLAQSRMRSHEARTGIRHDPVMIFPQGIFSSLCPEILKHNNYLAAVNTEISPTDSANSRTKIRDVWDVAIMAYGDFPIFTRRYAHHGVENFAFDILLGKPCLIVSHHDFFKNDCLELIELIEKLKSLNCLLTWRPLGELIRRACRSRLNEQYLQEVEMYGSELLVRNRSDHKTRLLIRKSERSPDSVAEVRCDHESTGWTSQVDQITFEKTIEPGNERIFRVLYRNLEDRKQVNRSLQFEFSVAARRILSEFRDDYLSRSSFLSKTSAQVKSAFTRAN